MSFGFHEWRGIMREKGHWKGFVLSLLLIALIIIVCSALDPRRTDLSERYEKRVSEVGLVKIVDECPNVRSEPIVYQNADESNSFGTTKKTDFYLQVTKIYSTNKDLDQNGQFYGLLVDEILATTEGKAWFPKKIKDDPDGIVWINEKYLTIIIY